MFSTEMLGAGCHIMGGRTMKIWELDWTEGKQYINLCTGNSHTIYTVKKRNLVDANGFTIHAEYRTSELADIDFEPYVDWSKVKVDTKIFVRDDENEAWSKRYFAKYENGNVFTFWFGFTSWTHPWVRPLTDWKYVKLAESGNENE